MIENIIKEWLYEFKRQNLNDCVEYATTVVSNNDVMCALYSYLDDANKYQGIINLVDVCDVLFKYYRSFETKLKEFTLHFLPQILYTYLNAVASSDKKTSRVIETLLIGIYNLEVVDENGQAKILSFRLPSLAESSIYHEPVSLAPASLTESALKRLEQRDTQLVRWGPLQPVDKLIAQNRLSVLAQLLFVYNRHIASLQKSSIRKLCEMTIKIMNQGFAESPNEVLAYRRSSLTGIENTSNRPRRIAVSSPLLCELLYNLFYAMFDDFKDKPRLAIDAIEAVHARASYQGLNDVLLVSNAVRNRYLPKIGDRTQDTSNVTVTSTATSTTTTTLSKSMITNASFRTKKLPEDIPIQDPHQEANDSLGAICEEKEEAVGTPEIHPRRSLPRMAASFGKRTKEKIAIAVKSSSVSSIKAGITKANSTLTNGGDASETDESGIDVGGSDISNLAVVDGDNATAMTTTPFNSRKSGAGPQLGTNITLDIDLSRSMQVSSV